MDAADAPPPPRLGGTGAGAVRVADRAGALRLRAWRGRRDVALVFPRAGGSPPEVADVRAALALARRRGVHHLVTGALAAGEVAPFLEVGFTVHERLHLLGHDMGDLPRAPAATARLRRARTVDHDAALAVDARAFEPFWRLDRAGLQDALRATASARFRVADDGGVVGYAVTGRAADRGYLQRLAVDPSRRGEGLGQALVLDGLRWLRRRRVRETVVNTQVANEGALRLYRALGFELRPHGLTVLARAVDGRP